MSHSHAPVKGTIMFRDRAAFCSEHSGILVFKVWLMISHCSFYIDMPWGWISERTIWTFLWWTTLKWGRDYRASAYIVLDKNLKLPFHFSEYCALLDRVSLAPRTLFLSELSLPSRGILMSVWSDLLTKWSDAMGRSVPSEGTLMEKFY